MMSFRDTVQGALVNLADRPKFREEIVRDGGVELVLQHLQAASANHETAETLPRSFLNEIRQAADC